MFKRTGKWEITGLSLGFLVTLILPHVIYPMQLPPPCHFTQFLVQLGSKVKIRENFWVEFMGYPSQTLNLPGKCALILHVCDICKCRFGNPYWL